MAKNKFSQYLLYAFGEIVLVVIGILIALQINIANQRKQERKAMDGYLSSIAKNIETDLQKARYILDKRVELFSRITYMRSNIGVRVMQLQPPLNLLGNQFSKDDVVFLSLLLRDVADLDYLNANSSGF